MLDFYVLINIQKIQCILCKFLPTNNILCCNFYNRFDRNYVTLHKSIISSLTLTSEALTNIEERNNLEKSVLNYIGLICCERHKASKPFRGYLKAINVIDDTSSSSSYFISSPTNLTQQRKRQKIYESNATVAAAASSEDATNRRRKSSRLGLSSDKKPHKKSKSDRPMLCIDDTAAAAAAAADDDNSNDDDQRPQKARRSEISPLFSTFNEGEQKVRENIEQFIILFIDEIKIEILNKIKCNELGKFILY
jgi:hypothetical protein